jgi:hypothetical protein
MKNLIEKLKAGATRLFAPLATASVLMLGAGSAGAQQAIPLKIYPLTNSVGFGIANGASNILTATSVSISAPPVQIWRGRGFAFNAGFYCTNASGSNVCMTLRFAARHTVGGTVITNWITTGQYAPMAINVANSGTTEVFYSTNIPPTFADNIDLVQFTTVTNNHLSTLFFDPTNTFFSVYP